jgi:hypothetical protein
MKTAPKQIMSIAVQREVSVPPTLAQMEVCIDSMLQTSTANLGSAQTLTRNTAAKPRQLVTTTSAQIILL